MWICKNQEIRTTGCWYIHSLLLDTVVVKFVCLFVCWGVCVCVCVCILSVMYISRVQKKKNRNTHTKQKPTPHTHTHTHERIKQTNINTQTVMSNSFFPLTMLTYLLCPYLLASVPRELQWQTNSLQSWSTGIRNTGKQRYASKPNYRVHATHYVSRSRPIYRWRKICSSCWYILAIMSETSGFKFYYLPNTWTYEDKAYRIYQV